MALCQHWKKRKTTRKFFEENKFKVDLERIKTDENIKNNLIIF